MNREIIQPGGAGVYPLIGDVQSQAGNPTVKVTGLQGVPITPVILVGGEVLTYDPTLGNWKPTLSAGFKVNGVTVSDDYIVSVNKDRPVSVNGV